MRASSIALGFVLAACAPEEEEAELAIDVCGQDEPVQILALEDTQVIGRGNGVARFGERWLFGVKTFEIPLTKVSGALGHPDNRPYEQIDAAIVVTGDCGEDPRVVAEGLDTIAKRIRDDEPWLGCNSLGSSLYWFDPDGAHPPLLVAEGLGCDGYLVVDQSVVYYAGDGVLARARLANGQITVDTLLDGIRFGEYLIPLRAAPPDALVAAREDDTVVAVDLRTAEVTTLTEGIESSFSISPNRRWLVWYEKVGEGLPYRMWLRDLEDGVDIEVGRDDWDWTGVDIGDTYAVIRGEAQFVPASTQVLALPSLREEWLEAWLHVDGHDDDRVVLDLRDGTYMRLDPESGDRTLLTPEFDEIVDGEFWSLTIEPYAMLDLPQALLPWDVIRATFDAPEPEIVRARVFSSVDLGGDRWIAGSEKDEHGLVRLEYIDGDTLEHHPFAEDVVPGSFDARNDSSITGPWRTDEMIYQVHTRASERTGVWRVRFTP
jgi:hypothetical protein